MEKLAQLFMINYLIQIMVQIFLLDGSIDYWKKKKIFQNGVDIQIEGDNMSFYIKKCPKCGHEVFTVEICTLPPIDYDQCYNCGWRNQERRPGSITVLEDDVLMQCFLQKDWEDLKNGREEE